ncbi:uridine 5'-monophosphate synthase [Anabrus simplex]|uniref:uridine 5'-monophosphate synthase n=1 Tax=Anabrus simplex TaxID=316456 RepID=UPI0034DDACE1
MPALEERIKSLVIKLHEIDALKFGDYKMKVGINSPVYFDLRVIVSHPAVMRMLAELMWDFTKSDVECQHICGVPYTALPIASIISVTANIPMLIRRKETKDYGTRKLIEGKFNKGDKCIIIEDVVTSGSSILETYRDLCNEGLDVTETIVVVDREQGGLHNLAKYGVKMRSLCTLSKIMDVLCEAGRVDSSTVQRVKDYLASSQVNLKNYIDVGVKTEVSSNRRLTMNFVQRAAEAKSPLSSRLLHLMSKKRTNLCLSADETTVKEILNLATTLGPYICMLKIHSDIIEDFSPEFTEKLVDISNNNDFLIMEDRKFADIGHIASMQYSRGYHRISSWADLVTVHPIPGDGILDGLKSAILDIPNKPIRGCFLVVEMSSKGNLCSPEYIKGALKLVSAHEDFVSGIVCQSSTTVTLPGLIQLTPGVQLVAGGDKLGQQYNSPEHVMLSLGADVAVVGRGITKAKDPTQAAVEYRDRLWAAYEKRII